MARGDSGRIVLEIEPALKGDLYSALARDGITLKQWFLRHAKEYLRDRGQISLFGSPAFSEESLQYKVESKQTNGLPKKNTLR